MSQEGAGQQAAALQNVAGQYEPAARGRSSESVSDLAVARSVAQVVRTVPGVVDLNLGFGALAATYGAGQRVAGVAVHHLTQDTIALEIHVILSQAHCDVVASAAKKPKGRDSKRPSPMTQIASQIRKAAYDAVQDMPSVVLVRTDVLIDDLR